MKKFVWAMLLYSFTAATAVAGDSSSGGETATAIAATSGPYAGVRQGAVINDINSSIGKSGAFGVFFGYKVDPELSTEVGYTHLGSADFGRVKFTTLEISEFLSFPLSDEYSLFCKLGVARTTESGSLGAATRLSPTYGLGGQFNINPSFGIRIGWDHYNFGDRIVWKLGNSDLYTLAGVFMF